MKHELQIHTEAVSAQMSHFYEVCSHIIALLSPVRPQTSDKQLSSLSYQLPLLIYVLQILIVTGGNGDTEGIGLNPLDSTEIYNTLVMGSWNIAQAALPRPMTGLRATNIDDMVLIFGIMNLMF